MTSTPSKPAEAKPYREFFIFFNGETYEAFTSLQSLHEKHNSYDLHVVEATTLEQALERVRVLEAEVKRLRTFFEMSSGFDAEKRAEEIYLENSYEYAERYRLINAYVSGFERAERYSIQENAILRAQLKWMIEKDTEEVKSRWADTYKNKTWNTEAIERQLKERDDYLEDIAAEVRKGAK